MESLAGVCGDAAWVGLERGIGVWTVPFLEEGEGYGLYFGVGAVFGETLGGGGEGYVGVDYGGWKGESCGEGG